MSRCARTTARVAIYTRETMEIVGTKQFRVLLGEARLFDANSTLSASDCNSFTLTNNKSAIAESDRETEKSFITSIPA
jgi:hypothetical protein